MRSLASEAPDDTVPVDPSGAVRQSWFRTDATDWGRGIRYVGILGNHDVISSQWLTNWNNALPGQAQFGENSRDGIYFYIVYENAIFIVLDTEHPSAAQTAWLEQVLQSEESQSKDWRFAFSHRPVYPCNAKSPFDEGLDWVQLFETYKVDISFVSHSHTYERTCAMIGGGCREDGVIHLNTSGVGASPRAINPTRKTTVRFGGREDFYDCSEILQSAKGEWNYFCHVAVDGCHLEVGCYPDDYASTGAPAYDTFSIDKPGCSADDPPDPTDPTGPTDPADPGASNPNNPGEPTGPRGTSDPLVGGCAAGTTTSGGTLFLLALALGLLLTKSKTR